MDEWINGWMDCVSVSVQQKMGAVHLQTHKGSFLWDHVTFAHCPLPLSLTVVT